MIYHHLSVLVHRQAEKYGDRTALKYKDYNQGKWFPISWNGFSLTIKETANALVSLGVEETENIGIFSQNMPECLYVDFAAFANRAVTVPFYATSSPSQVQYMINDAEIRFLFVGQQFQYDAAFKVLGLCDTLKQLIIFDRSVKIDERDKTSIYFDDLLAIGKGLKFNDVVEERTARASGEDLANILYTSGTTGEPKGVMLHHSNYLAALKIHDTRLVDFSDKDVSLNFLPLTHVFEKAWTFLCIHRGVLVCVNLLPQEVQTAMREIRPTVMCSVPRFWEKVYQGVIEKIEATKGVKKQLMMDAISVGRKHNLDYVRLGKKPPRMLHLKYKIYEKTVFHILKKTIGIENGNFFPSAGAAVPEKVADFVHSVGINMITGYGLTESTATASCTWKTGYELNSVGTPLDGVHVSFSDEGEILLKGETITKGYYRKPEETAKAIDADGWFHTGDIGHFSEGGELYMTERLKDLFKTSNGKYIAPQALESRLVVDQYVDQISLIADQRKYVTALIVPDYRKVEEYAKSKKIAYSSRKELLQNEQIYKMFKDRIDTLQQHFAYYEQIKKFVLLEEPFSLERGELTNTLKIKRPIVAKNYEELINEMYPD